MEGIVVRSAHRLTTYPVDKILVHVLNCLFIKYMTVGLVVLLVEFSQSPFATSSFPLTPAPKITAVPRSSRQRARESNKDS